MKTKNIILTFLFLMMSACASESIPDPVIEREASSSPASPLEIVRAGESLPLQSLLGLQMGAVVDLEVLGNPSSIAWVTLDPAKGFFELPGKLHVTTAGIFQIGVLNETQSDYILVEVLPPSESAVDTNSNAPTSSPSSPSPEESSPNVEPPLPPEACVPTTCEREGKNCGEISNGCGETLRCGECSNPGELCGISRPNVCEVCVPTTCEREGKNCGVISDGCGNLLRCGSCSQPNESCAAAYVQNVCARPLNEVLSFNPGPLGERDSPENRRRALGSPLGSGLVMGSTDTLSLGVRGEIVIRFNLPITNGEGVDFIVFENPFHAGSPRGRLFFELAEVSVSQNGIDFFTFPCDSMNSTQLYPGCAGVHPVLTNADTNTISPIDSRVSGGDGFDLQELGLDWIQYIRIQDLGTVTDATMYAGFDLDAISIVHP